MKAMNAATSVSAYYGLFVSWDSALDDRLHAICCEEFGEVNVTVQPSEWTQANLLCNLRRFYGLEAKLLHEKALQITASLLKFYIIRDCNPVFQELPTNTGIREVHKKSVRLKSFLRGIVHNKYSVHCSDTHAEGARQISLVTSKAFSEFQSLYGKNRLCRPIQYDLVGAASWDSVEQFLAIVTTCTQSAIVKVVGDDQFGNTIIVITTDFAETMNIAGISDPLPCMSDGLIVAPLIINGRQVKIIIIDPELSELSESYVSELIREQSSFNGSFIELSQKGAKSLDLYCKTCGFFSRKILLGQVSENDLPALDGLQYVSRYPLMNQDRIDFGRLATQHSLSLPSGRLSSFGLSTYVKTKFSIADQLKKYAGINEWDLQDHAHLELRSYFRHNRNQILAMADEITSKIQPSYLKKSPSGFFESRIFCFKLPMLGRTFDICLKDEFFMNKEFGEFVIDNAASLPMSITSCYLPRFYGYVTDPLRNRMISIMQRVKGITMHEWLTKHAHTDGFAPQKMRSILSSLATVTRQIEEYGFCHRDIWEKNIILSDGKAVLVDFTNSCPTISAKNYSPPHSVFLDDREAFSRIELIAYAQQFDRRIAPNVCKANTIYPWVESSEYWPALKRRLDTLKVRFEFSEMSLPFILSGSTLLALLGLRANNDIDVLHPAAIDKSRLPAGLSSHNFQLRYMGYDGPWKVYLDPSSLIFYEGYYFIDPMLLLQLKATRISYENKAKDLEDYKLLIRAIQRYPG